MHSPASQNYEGRRPTGSRSNSRSTRPADDRRTPRRNAARRITRGGRSRPESPEAYWIARDRSAGVLGRWFLILLSIVLTGYTFFGRGFAYIGVAPVFIGEITLFLGGLAAIQSHKLGYVCRLPVVRVLLLVMIWGAINTVPYIDRYGATALRDGAIWGYGTFAIIVAAVILAHPDRIRILLVRYRLFALGFALSAAALYILANVTNGGFTVPGSPSPILTAKGGDMQVHLAGIAIFTMIGFANKRPLILTMTAIDLVVIMVSNRGGMVSFMLAITFLLILRPPRLRVAPIIYGLLLVVVTVILINPVIHINKRRTLSLEQVQENVESVLYSSRASSLESTKAWRVHWWVDIINYTVFGKYFFTGKGYGINLANSDGYQVYKNESLRSPHSAHMTFLARSGVPGLLLWILFLSSWWIGMMKVTLSTRKRGETRWFGIFAFLTTYWTAFVINSSFDVFLEGPMGGIWFWCVTGVGIAALELYGTQPELFLERSEA